MIPRSGSKRQMISIAGMRPINSESDKHQNKARTLTYSIKDAFPYMIGDPAPSLSTVNCCKKETQ